MEPSLLQRRFLDETGREALHAAPSGGGNTTALVLAALASTRYAAYRGLLLCREPRHVARLRDATMALAADATWDAATSSLTLPSGATIKVGSMEKACSAKEYGREPYHFVGFDRILEFLDEQYAAMACRAASLGGTDVKAAVRASGDPEGPGMGWVRRRFTSPVVATPDDCPWLPAEDRRELLADPTLCW